MAAAKRICATCPVKANCLEYAMAIGPTDDVWGGTTPDELQAAGAARWPDPGPALPGRANEYLDLPAGLTARQAGEPLGVSSRTVERYKRAARKAAA